MKCRIGDEYQKTQDFEAQAKPQLLQFLTRGCYIRNMKIRQTQEHQLVIWRSNPKGSIYTKQRKYKVLVEENLHARTIILNRAHRLNALSYQMVSRLHEVYTAREKDPEVKLVILRVGFVIWCRAASSRPVAQDF
ncbi:hypothetical protein C5167_040708 [Papaver somniferum]|uniref:3-hydroxyisobutyryl-CoA hydrolase n=1 Tax=Papaver somniferum TaxID=3469 RepID=A0A4Y7IJ77_PAPSO|nr:hypothetical protein C5167_040708 [Papaver somniferum]